MKLTIKKNPDKTAFNEITSSIKDNDGYCCCSIEKSSDTTCMCKDFREKNLSGFCHCGAYYKVPRAEVITLCGSTKFKDEFLEAQKRLTLEGKVVITVGLFGHSGDSEALTEETKEMLDEIHKQKIEMSDAIYVINKNGYIGSSTKSEIEWAQALGKTIYYLEGEGE